MSEPIEIRRLQVADAEGYRAVRLAALKTTPEAFGSVYEVEVARSLEEHSARLRSSMVFGALHDACIVGMLGLKQELGPEDAHKGFLWGFFVEPDHRCRGIGTDLISAVLDASRDFGEQVHLSVVRGNSGAVSLFETFQFKTYGIEPRALKCDGRYWNEVLVALIV